MKILIVVHDLISEKSHLMPWRTCCETVNHLQQLGHNTRLLSLGSDKKKLRGGMIPSNTRQIRKASNDFRQDITEQTNHFSPDVIFWPVSWRESSYRLKVISQYGIPIVAWFPGGVYSLQACIHALKTMQFKAIFPYLREAISPRKRRVNFFVKHHVIATLTMTETTSRCIVNSGWNQSHTFVIPPGKDDDIKSNTITSLPDSIQLWLQEGCVYYLYMGPPSGIRGIYDLLDAFEIAASLNSEIRLICLFRSDALLETDKIKQKISTMKYNKLIYCTWASLPKEELNCFMASCHAVVMPFIFVPSEIPLAIIEVMAFGKPVISTSPGGTGEFVSTFGLSPSTGDTSELAQALIDLKTNNNLYASMCAKTKQTFDAHPSWGEMSKAWLHVANFALENFALENFKSSK